MGVRLLLAVCAALGAAAGCYCFLAPPSGASTAAAAGPDQAAFVCGVTRPAPGHSATLTPQVRQPVVKIAVQAGQRVKKDQLLIQLDDENAQAEVRQKKAKMAEAKAALDQVKAKPRENKIDAARAEVEQAVIGSKHAKERRDRLKPLAEKGVIAAKDYDAARAKYQQALQAERAARDQYDTELHTLWNKEVAEKEAGLRAAEAELDAANRQLDDYTVKAPIAGVVSWLRVDLGTILRPGTGAWGQILDVSELDVQCDVSTQQARHLAVGQKATVTAEGDDQLQVEGEVVSIGVAIDGRSGKLPVVVRVKNADGWWPCNLPVRVVFGNRETAKETAVTR
jgi:multidrug resistance efflux pump